MNQETLWMAISLPIGFFSLIVSYFIFLKYKPIPKHKILFGTIVAFIILGTIIGSIFISDILACVLIGLFFPPFALWTWFMVQPTIRDWDKKRNKIMNINNKKGTKNGK